MAEDPVIRATRRYRQAQRVLEARRFDLVLAVGRALVEHKRPQTEIIGVTGFTREHVRRLRLAYEEHLDAPDPFDTPPAAA